MARLYSSRFSSFLRRYLPGSDEMSLKELSDALGGVNPAMLSRLRSGTQDVGSTVARRIATQIGRTTQDRERIYLEALATKRDSIEQPTETPTLMGTNHSRLGFFVEFRQKPLMRSPREGAQTTALLAKWINEGLNYAMFSPNLDDRKGHQSSSIRDVQPAIAKFLNNVHQDVVDSYLSLRVESLRQLAAARGFPGTHEMLPQAELLDKRLRLYIARISSMWPYAAVGYKLQVKSDRGSLVGFEWELSPIRGGEGPEQRLREKDLEPDEGDAIKARLFPVIQCFNRLSILPSSTDDLNEFAKTFTPPGLEPLPSDSRQNKAADHNDLHQWEVYKSKVRVENILEAIHTEYRTSERLGA
jgi:hypothetical protein